MRKGERKNTDCVAPVLKSSLYIYIYDMYMIMHIEFIDIISINL